MASSLDKARAGWIPYYDSSGILLGHLDPAKRRSFTEEDRRHFDKMSALMKRIAELEAIEAAADRDIQAAERQIADATKRETEAAKRETEAAKREAEAAKRETEAAKRELEASAQFEDATQQLQAIEGVQRRLERLAQKIQEIQHLIKKRNELIKEAEQLEASAKRDHAEAARLGAEADKASMLKALSIMIFPQFKTGSEATRATEVKQARDVALSFSDKIVVSHANRDWHVIRNKSPHLTAKAIANLIKAVIADAKLPKEKGLFLDFSGFTDEIDIEPAAEFIKATTNLKQITFGQLNDSQLTALAKGVVTVVQAKGPDFIKFTNEDTTAKFREALAIYGSGSKPAKPLPAVPPKPVGKNPLTVAIPISTGGSNVKIQLVPDRGSPPKGQA